MHKAEQRILEELVSDSEADDENGKRNKKWKRAETGKKSNKENNGSNLRNRKKQRKPLAEVQVDMYMYIMIKKNTCNNETRRHIMTVVCVQIITNVVLICRQPRNQKTRIISHLNLEKPLSGYLLQSYQPLQ